MSFMTPKELFYIFIFLGVLLEAGGDFFFKKWSIENKTSVLIFGLLIYFAGAYFWAMSLKFEGLAKAVAIFTILNMLIAVSVGILYFNEGLTMTNRIGIILGIISIILVEFQ